MVAVHNARRVAVLALAGHRVRGSGAGLAARAMDVGTRARAASRAARTLLIDDVRRRALGARDPERRVVGADTALALRSILERRCARQTALAERLRSVRHLPRLRADLTFAARCAHLPDAASGTVALVLTPRRRGTLCPGVAQRWCVAAGPVARDDIRRQTLLTDAERRIEPAGAVFASVTSGVGARVRRARAGAALVPACRPSLSA